MRYLHQYYHLSPGMSTWTKMKNLWCKHGGTFKNLAQAQFACLTLGSNCHGVYDDHCDGHGEAHVCKASSFSTSNSGGCVYKQTTESPTVFKPTTSVTLKRAVREYLDVSPNNNCPDRRNAPSDFPDVSSIKFERLDKSEPTVSFQDLHGSVIFAVRRLG